MDQASDLKWFSENETDADKMKRQLYQKDIERDNLAEQMGLQATKLSDVQASLREALYKLEVEAGKSVKLEATLAQTTKDLRQERIVQANLHQALDEAAQTQSATARELKQLQHELDSTSFQSTSQLESLTKERDALQARVRSLESQSSRGRPQTPPPMPSSRTPNPRRSSSADTGLQVMRLETELEEARRAQQVAGADASDARSRLSKLSQELMRTQNSAMAAESHAKQEIQTLQDEVEEQRYAIEGLEQELAAREQETEELKAQLAQPQVVVQPPEADLLDFDMSFADDSRPSTSHVRRSVAGRARLSTLRPRSVILESTFTLDPISAETPTNGSFTLDDLSPSSKATISTVDQTSATRRSDLRSSRRSSTAAFDQSQIAKILDAVDRLRTEREALRRKLHFVELEVQLGATPGEVAKDQRIEELGQDIERLRAELEVAQQVAETEDDSERASVHDEEVENLFARIEDVSTELERRSVRIDDAELESDDLHEQLEDLSRMLQHAEAEKDDYQNQVAELHRRVRHLSRDLEEAEDRCAALRQEHLANPTGSPGPIKGEIKALEDRVLRRTEQIGSQQHDLKRLEMNLRIAEDDLEEVNAELEAYQREKACLIEDNEAARAQRDEANQRQLESQDRIFDLEEQLAVFQTESSNLQQSLEDIDSSRAEEISSLVSLLFEYKARLRVRTRVQPSRTTSSASEPKDVDLSADALDLSTTRLNVMSRLHQFTQIEQDNQQLAEYLQEAEERIIALQEEMDEFHARGQPSLSSATQEDLDVLLRELDTKSAHCVELQHSVDDAMVQLSDLQDTKDALRETERQFHVLQQRLQVSELKAAELAMELQSRASVIRELEANQREMEAAQDAWEHERIELEQDVQAMYDTELRRSAELHDSKLAYETLRKAQESIHDSLRQENTALAEKVRALQTELSQHLNAMENLKVTSIRQLEEVQKTHEVELRAATESVRELQDELAKNKSLEVTGVSSPTATKLAKLEASYERLSAECKEMEITLQFKAELLEEADDKVYELMRERKQLQKQLHKASQLRSPHHHASNQTALENHTNRVGSIDPPVDHPMDGTSGILSPHPLPSQVHIEQMNTRPEVLASTVNNPGETTSSATVQSKPRLKGLKLPPSVGALRPAGTRPVLRSIPSQPRLVTQSAESIKENLPFSDNTPVKENISTHRNASPMPSPPTMPTLVFAPSSSASKKRSREDDLPAAPLRTAAILMPSTTPLSVRIRKTQGRAISGGFTPSRSGGVRDLTSHLEVHSSKRAKATGSTDLGSRSPMPVLNFTHRDAKGLRARLETSTGNRPLHR